MNANYLNPLWLKFHHHVSSINWITLLVYDVLGQPSYFTWLRSLLCPYVSNEVLTSYVKTHVLSAKFNVKAVKFWKLLLNPQRRQGYSVQSANTCTSEVRLNYERKKSIIQKFSRSVILCCYRVVFTNAKRRFFFFFIYLCFNIFFLLSSNMFYNKTRYSRKPSLCFSTNTPCNRFW